MATKVSRGLVIDASIARAAGGEDAIFPTSKNCRDFLKTVLKVCHRIVMTSDISDEWNRNQSNFARLWRVSMVARKKMIPLYDISNDELRNKIQRINVSESNRKAMRKDIILIEAAIATDFTIIALDETVRKFYSKAANTVGELKIIVWVNPDYENEQPLIWLENGAKNEKKRRLGFYTKDI